MSEHGSEKPLDRGVERGVRCYYGVDGACLSIRCGSNCDSRFDRMHSCPACLIGEIRHLRVLVTALGGDPYSPVLPPGSTHPGPEDTSSERENRG